MKRVAELDGLRGLAAAGVVAYHLWPNLFYRGQLGLVLFFVLSGYLITGIVLEGSGTQRFLRKFYVRRCLRIWPPYYLTILILVAAGLGPAYGLGYFLTYTQQFPLYLQMGPHPPSFSPEWPIFSHSWTLAIEEQFYLVWPALLLLVGARGALPLALTALVATAVCRAAGLEVHTLLGCMDGLAAGGLLAVRRRLGWSDRARDAALVGLAAWILGQILWTYWPYRPLLRALWGVTPAMSFYVLVAWASRHAGTRRTAPLRFRPLTWLGTMSYGVYLYHIPVMTLCALGLARASAAMEARWLLDVPLGALVIPATLAVAAMSWYALERPLLSLKRFFDYQAHSSRVEEQPRRSLRQARRHAAHRPEPGPLPFRSRADRVAQQGP